LKDFIEDRLGLPVDEFNRVPVAGITTTLRLSELLDAAAFSFLVMTGEDEQVDGTLHLGKMLCMKLASFRDGWASAEQLFFWRRDARSSLISTVWVRSDLQKETSGEYLKISAPFSNVKD
jgi:hypothetical protein